MLKCLYGTCASNKHIVGKCWKHNCLITVKQLKQKQCLKKQCSALEKYDHEYWKQRDLIKQKRRNKNMDGIFV